MTNTNITDIQKIIVHGGVFHLDDLLCAALVRHYNPTVEIIRDNNPDISQSGPETGVAICDIGKVHDPERWLFDHHQDRYTTDSKEPVRAACGRLWEHFGDPKLRGISEFVHAVDLHDTGVKWTPLGAAVRSFAPNWDEEGSMDTAFFEALEWLQPLVDRLIAKDESTARATDALDAIPVDDGVLVLEQFIPWMEWANEHPIRGCVYPGRDPGTWNAQIHKGTFPADWLSNRPEGIVFMTAWRSMIVTTSKERAIALVKEVFNHE